MSDPLRGTGRTTRGIKNAMRRAIGQNTTVWYIIASMHQWGHIKKLIDEIWKSDEIPYDMKLHNHFKCVDFNDRARVIFGTIHDGPFDLELMRPMGIPAERVLVDHHAREVANELRTRRYLEDSRAERDARADRAGDQGVA